MHFIWAVGQDKAGSRQSWAQHQLSWSHSWVVIREIPQSKIHQCCGMRLCKLAKFVMFCFTVGTCRYGDYSPLLKLWIRSEARRVNMCQEENANVVVFVGFLAFGLAAFLIFFYCPQVSRARERILGPIWDLVNFLFCPQMEAPQHLSYSEPRNTCILTKLVFSPVYLRTPQR